MPLMVPTPKITADELDRIARQTEAENRAATALPASGLRRKQRPEPARLEEIPGVPETPPAKREPTPLPDWRVHAGRCKAEPDPATQKHGMMAVLEFRSSEGRGPNVLQDVYTRPVSEQIRKALDAAAPVEYRRKLQRQQADAEKVRKLALAKIAELQGKRTALEIEVPDGLAKKLAAIDAQLAEQQERLDAAEGDLAILRPLMDKSLADAESVLESTYFAAAAEAKQNIAAKRTEVLGRILDAVAPMLTELASLDAAANVAHTEKAVVIAEAKRHLRDAPATA